MKKRYVIVGTGMRCYTMFVRNLIDHFGDFCEIVGVYDTNKIRSEYFKKDIGEGCIQYFSFEEMLDAEKPDAVIVTTPDSFHHEYIIKALDAGYDAISEKPITNTYERCREIREAEKRSGKRVTVTFNCRFMPIFAKMKSLIAEGKIGRVYSINYNYYLNRSHGADYLKRWHRLMEFSEGMLLHKSTHHFDVVNWLLEDEPRFVSAIADQSFYNNKEKRLGERCHTCKDREKCESGVMQLDYLSDDLYYKAEGEDGYFRDRCAYGGDADIYDNISVSVKYNKGAILSYSLNLFSQREGYRLAIIGEKGAIITNIKSMEGGEDGIFFVDNSGNREKIDYEAAVGSHAGGDLKLLSMIFKGGEEDPLGMHATCFDGFASAIIGIGANISIKERKTVDLLPYLSSLK